MKKEYLDIVNESGQPTGQAVYVGGMQNNFMQARADSPGLSL